MWDDGVWDIAAERQLERLSIAKFVGDALDGVALNPTLRELSITGVGQPIMSWWDSAPSLRELQLIEVCPPPLNGLVSAPRLESLELDAASRLAGKRAGRSRRLAQTSFVALVESCWSGVRAGSGAA